MTVDRALRRALTAATVVWIASQIVFGAPSASGHDGRVVGNRYEISVGFYREPARVGETNYLDLSVTDVTEKGRPVANLESKLKVEVTAGTTKFSVPLSPLEQTPGAYRGAVSPPAQGLYQVKISGRIESVDADELFEIGPVEGRARASSLTRTTVGVALVLLLASALGGLKFWRSTRLTDPASDGRSDSI